MEKENVEEIEEGKQKEKEDKWVKWAVGFDSTIDQVVWNFWWEMCYNIFHCNLDSSNCSWSGQLFSSWFSNRLWIDWHRYKGMNLGHTIWVQQ
jgi:hypothetical protein